MRLARLGLVVLSAALPAVAAAQTAAPGEPPTAGVYNPTLGVAGDGDASAVEKNPALLGHLKSWSGVFLHSELDPAGNVGGRGDGFFAASPLPYLKAFIVGAGFQWTRPPAVFSYRDAQKLSLALAWRPHPAVALGISYAHVWSHRPPVSQGIDTMDLALLFRLGRWAATSLVVRDVTAPVFDGLPLQRVYEPEIAVRPFGRHWLEIGLAARFGERRGDIDPRVRVWGVPWPGITLKTELELRRDVNQDGVPENDVRVAMGVAFDLSRIGVSAFGLWGTTDGQVGGNGFTVAARVSGERYPAFWAGPRWLEKIEIGSSTKGRALARLLLYLRRLERERGVDGVVLVVGDLPGGFATAEELRGALLRLRRAKKRVYAYLAETNTRGYYVATAAERIYLDPAGGIRLIGLQANSYFLKGTGELLGLKADFVRIGEYKSAPEMFTERAPTPPARAQREALTEDTFISLLDGIAAGRGVARAKARALVDGGPYSAGAAKAAGLVDALKTGGEIEGAIAEHAGRRYALRSPSTAPERGDSWARPRVAILFVDGDIVNGESFYVPLLDLRYVGLRTLTAALNRLKSDPTVRAVVLRVDSPGGSALASDLLARQVAQLAQDKPVVASFGDKAASGGYFLAAPAGKIFAAPSSITGSIGIYTGKVDVSGLAAKLGVHVERYERGLHASMDSLFRPYTDEERAHILQQLRYHYARFVETVARGRKLGFEAVDAVGRGHVWSGKAARERKLVDELGSLADAVAEAQKKAGLKEGAPVEIVEQPEEKTLLGQLLGLLGVNLSARAAEPALVPGLSSLAGALPGSVLLEPSTPQARIEEDLAIR
jgi:protease-4